MLCHFAGKLRINPYVASNELNIDLTFKPVRQKKGPCSWYRAKIISEDVVLSSSSWLKKSYLANMTHQCNGCVKAEREVESLQVD